MLTTTTTLRKARRTYLKIFVAYLSFVIFTTLLFSLFFERFAIITNVYANNLMLLRLARAFLQEL